MSVTRRKRTPRPILNASQTKLIPSEYQECKTFWDYCQRIDLLKDNMIHIANEGQRDEWFTKALLNIGMRPGILDYHLPVRNDRYIGLWLEMKRIDQRNIKKRANQNEWIDRLNKNGHYATYAYGCEDAIQIYTAYINNKL